MESSSAVPPAGWFPDPGHTGNERWWSGARWTEHVRPPVASASPVATLVEERRVEPEAVEPELPVHPSEPPVLAEQLPAEPIVEAAPVIDAAPVEPAVAPGFVLPSATPLFADDALSAAELERGERRARRHAAPIEEPVVPVDTAPPPVGYTSSADPAIANRYRAAMAEPEPEPEPDPFESAVLTPAPTLLFPELASIPSEWQGVPVAAQPEPMLQGAPVPGADASGRRWFRR